ncbi:T-lymphocyte activation antigen CD86 isoform X2 [Pangasianodon hypophthalmus]|uniref:T-lymphocyte activation antigen CD86 isoform X2 n=1 Tax=Pangasianodon hypophthalmus TaxID=310915 RepID=UPI002306EC03|nr:T-lymphocyte activation antigen CD86 isoform X2 [Pangasianodon hypophthalmus]
MSRRCFLFFLVQLLIHNVLAQNIAYTCKTVVGGTVILPCFTKNAALVGDVFWRYEERKENKAVFDIISGKEDFQDQSQEYRGRVKSFPTDYAKGNFSIQLIDVKLSDSGTYTCIIPKSPPNVLLIVEEKKQITDPKNGDVTRGASSVFLLGCSLLYSLAF